MEPNQLKRSTQIDLNRLRPDRPRRNELFTSKPKRNVEVPADTKGLRQIRSVEAVKNNLRPHEYLVPINRSPWDIYELVKELCLSPKNRIKIIRQKKIPKSRRVMVLRPIVALYYKERQKLLQKLQHPNLLFLNEVYHSQDTSYLVFDPIICSIISLYGHWAIDETIIAVIIKQVINILYSERF